MIGSDLAWATAGWLLQAGRVLFWGYVVTSPIVLAVVMLRIAVIGCR